MSKSPSLVESNNALQPKPIRKAFRRFLGLIFCALVAHTVYISLGNPSSISTIARADRAAVLSKCANIHTPAGPPPSFNTAMRLREGSDRWVPGTPPTLLRNAKIWTGARNGTEVVYGDVLLDKGLIVAVGYIPPNLLATAKARGGGEVNVLDVAGKWITPGLVDLHSHIGVHSLPGLKGTSCLYLDAQNSNPFFQEHPMGTRARIPSYPGFEASTG